MFEMFDEIFEKVMKELNVKEWYELFDSEDFERVCKAIAEHEDWVKTEEHADYWDVCADNSNEFIKWNKQMAMDL